MVTLTLAADYYDDIEKQSASAEDAASKKKKRRMVKRRGRRRKKKNAPPPMLGSTLKMIRDAQVRGWVVVLTFWCDRESREFVSRAFAWQARIVSFPHLLSRLAYFAPGSDIAFFTFHYFARQPPPPSPLLVSYISLFFNNLDRRRQTGQARCLRWKSPHTACSAPWMACRAPRRVASTPGPTVAAASTSRSHRGRRQGMSVCTRWFCDPVTNALFSPMPPGNKPFHASAISPDPPGKGDCACAGIRYLGPEPQGPSFPFQPGDFPLGPTELIEAVRTQLSDSRSENGEWENGGIGRETEEKGK